MTTSFWTKLFDLVAPRTCAVCGCRLSASESVLCPVCHLHLPLTHFWRTPYDNEMARLFYGQIPLAGGLPGQRPNSMERAAALFFFSPHAQASKIVYDLKYHRQRHIGEPMGRIAALTMAADGFFDGIDLIAPVPLTRRRQWGRGYNQSMEIARGVSLVTRIPVAVGLAKRVSFDGSQTRKRGRERLRNVEDVFRLSDAEKARGRHILIVDDIVTTGATVASFARQLCLAPGVRVSVLALGFTKN